MIRDLGLKVGRKRTMFAEQFEPYRPQDYTGLIREYIDTKGLKEKDVK